MKNILTITGFFFAGLILAQAPPQGIPYQGIARDVQGNEISGIIGVEITIHQGPNFPNIVYQERWTPTTNQFGLFSIVIGTSANIVQGNFSSINWSSGTYFLEVGLDPNGGTSYTSLGMTQFFSVPYAFHAGTATSGNPGPQGPSGPSGATGATGSTGPTGPSSVIAGSFGQTLFHDGTTFSPTSNLYNNGTQIGINETNPVALLTIGSGTQNEIQFTGVSNADIVSSNQLNLNAGTVLNLDAFSMNLRTGFLDRFHIANNGNIGIGTILPNYNLEVSGSTKTGSLYINNYIMPLSDGTSGQFMATDGAGNISFQTVNGLPPGQFGQTMFHNGINWMPTLNLFNNGSKVGIGTSFPTALLHIFPQNALSNMMVESGSSYDARIDIVAPLGQNAILGFAETTGGYFANLYVSNSKLYVQDGSGVPTMTFVNKKVGIGSQTPGSDLTIQSIGTTNTTSALNIMNGSGTNMLFVRNDGNIGINNASPQAKLDVSGQVKITDGSQGDGKVFTSNAVGGGKWEFANIVTVIPMVNCGGSLSNVTGTPTAIPGSTASFTKTNASTKIEVILNTILIVDDLLTSTNGVVFEIRIDGVPAGSNSGRFYYFKDNANAPLTTQLETAMLHAIFSGLSSGSHTVSLHAFVLSGNGALGARFDWGCWNSSSIIIKEIQ